MSSLKTKTRIGKGLYIIAIILLLIHIYQMNARIENVFFDFAGWIAMIIASSYMLWLSIEKKKSTGKEKD